MLRKSEKLKDEYIKVKKEAMKKAKGDRWKYGEMKGKFIKKVISNENIK